MGGIVSTSNHERPELFQELIPSITQGGNNHQSIHNARLPIGGVSSTNIVRRNDEKISIITTTNNTTTGLIRDSDRTQLTGTTAESISNNQSQQQPPQQFHRKESQQRLDEMNASEMECSSITNYLYVSGKSVAENAVLLKQYGIKRIINCAASIVPNYFPSEYKYLNLHLLDGREEDISWFVSKVIQFIIEGEKQQEKILIHCEKGISRSCAFAIAYRMWSTGEDMVTTNNYVKERRRICNPHIAFYTNLLEMGKIFDGPAVEVSLLFRCSFHAAYDHTTAVLKLCRNLNTRELFYPATSLLNPQGVYVVRAVRNSLHSLYVWRGRMATVSTYEKAFQLANQMIGIFSHTKNPIVTIEDGNETEEFLSYFIQDGGFTVPADGSASFNDFYDFLPSNDEIQSAQDRISGQREYYSLSSPIPLVGHVPALEMPRLETPQTTLRDSNNHKFSSGRGERSRSTSRERSVSRLIVGTIVTGAVEDNSVRERDIIKLVPTLSRNTPDHSMNAQQILDRVTNIMANSEKPQVTVGNNRTNSPDSNQFSNVSRDVAPSLKENATSLPLPTSESPGFSCKKGISLNLGALPLQSNVQPLQSPPLSRGKLPPALTLPNLPVARTSLTVPIDNNAEALSVRSDRSLSKLSLPIILTSARDSADGGTSTRRKSSPNESDLDNIRLSGGARPMSGQSSPIMISRDSSRTNLAQLAPAEARLTPSRPNSGDRKSGVNPRQMMMLRVNQEPNSPLIPPPSSTSSTGLKAIESSSSSSARPTPVANTSAVPSLTLSLDFITAQSDNGRAPSTMKPPLLTRGSDAYQNLSPAAQTNKSTLFQLSKRRTESDTSISSNSVNGSGAELFEWKMYHYDDLDDADIYLLLCPNLQHHLWIGLEFPFDDCGVEVDHNERPIMNRLLKWLTQVRLGDIHDQSLAGNALLTMDLSIHISGEETNDFWDSLN